MCVNNNTRRECIQKDGIHQSKRQSKVQIETTRKGAHPTRNGSSIYYSPSLAEKKEGIKSILIHALLKIIVTHIQWGMFSLLCKTENVPPTCCHLMQSHEQRLASLRTPTPLP